MTDELDAVGAAMLADMLAAPALSPGPWALRDLAIVPAGSSRAMASMCCGVSITREQAETDGRAMASAHEALAVLKELAKPEHELHAEFGAATGRPLPIYDASRADYCAWLRVRNDRLRTKAEAVLEKAGVKP